MPRKIYLASSWRNELYPILLDILTKEGHAVYDFRSTGFSWDKIDPKWEGWTLAESLGALEHPLAKEHYKIDRDAMAWADTCVMVMPCGNSAHAEMGWFAKSDKPVCVYGDLFDSKPSRPDLMHGLADHCSLTLPNLLDWLRLLDNPPRLKDVMKVWSKVEDAYRQKAYKFFEVEDE